MTGHRPALVPTRWRWIEMSVAFISFPIGLYFVRDDFASLIVPTLLVTSAGCLLILLLDPAFDRSQLGLRGRSVQDGDRPSAGSMLRLIVLYRFLPGAAVISLLVAVLRPELLFAFPQREPTWWLVVMLAYPLLSVYPQELIFRTFFFHRYESLFKTRLGCLLLSAAVFGLAHLFFNHWLAPTMTAVGGYLFASTYARSRSTVWVSIEHALWGDFLFTIGLGHFFWGGSIRALI